MVAVDDAQYETVMSLLDSLGQNGISNIFVMPPFLGTNPSKSIKHWIKFVVHGAINHPFQTAMISTERFRTWRETLILLPLPEFEYADNLSRTRIAKGDCVQPADLTIHLAQAEHRLLLVEHSDDRTQSCLLPSAGTSCEFLTTMKGLSEIRWGKGDLGAINAVAAEIGCNAH